MIVYKLTNTANAKVYVGKTSDFRRRLYEHFARRRGFVGKAIAKYGPDRFVAEVLEQGFATEAEMNAAEIRWIAALRSNDERFGYNLTKGGDGGFLTAEQRAAHSGPNAWMYGRKHSPETRAAWSAKRKGVAPSEKCRAATSALFKGVPKPAAQREKMAAAAVARATPEYREMMSAATKGKPKSEPHKQALREAALRRYGSQP